MRFDIQYFAGVLRNKNCAKTAQPLRGDMQWEDAEGADGRQLWWTGYAREGEVCINVGLRDGDAKKEIYDSRPGCYDSRYGRYDGNLFCGERGDGKSVRIANVEIGSRGEVVADLR